MSATVSHTENVTLSKSQPRKSFEHGFGSSNLIVQVYQDGKQVAVDIEVSETEVTVGVDKGVVKGNDKTYRVVAVGS